MAHLQPMPVPEAMNATPHHSKVKVTVTLADPLFLAGDYVAGKVELECRADKGLGIGVIFVELFAIQELSSRNHSATSTFLHSKRLFQGPALPPSNAVYAHPQPGYPSLPPNYWQARKGISTFLFRIPLPESSPSSINFVTGLARVRYELRATVGVVWKGERRLVVDNHSIDVVSAFPYELSGAKGPEAVIIGESGKLWVHGALIGPVIVAGESACIELQVKNHSTKKNNGLTLSLTRTLLLPGSIGPGNPGVQLSDTLTHVPFRGPEYQIPPGAEGVATLVFDVPKHSRGIRGGILDGDETDPPRTTESLFEIRCSVDIRMTMGFGNKDLLLSIPVTVVHPKAVPPEPMSPPSAPALTPIAAPYTPQYAAYAAPPLPISPFVVDHQQRQVWLPPLHPYSQPFPHPHMMHDMHHYVATPPPQQLLALPTGHYGTTIPRPVSAGGNVSQPDTFTLPAVQNVSGLPTTSTGHPWIGAEVAIADISAELDTEEGKGQRALRVSQHLRLSSRTRSVSPQSHRFPMGYQQNADAVEQTTPGRQPAIQPQTPTSPLLLDRLGNLSLPAKTGGVVHSPRPQLTPKHSYNNLRPNAPPKSERVEELERMADVVVAQAMDLSGDIPKDDLLQPAISADGQIRSVNPKEEEVAELNKTLPAPPVPSGKYKPTSPPAKSALNSLFKDPPIPHTKSAPVLLPSDKAPPTPTLQAVLPKRYPRSNINDFLAPGDSESGLDALERRLLAEVGTRKFDKTKGDSKRPDVRAVMGVGPINIPMKSPEPLNDSAISSLTLANDHRSVDEEANRDASPNLLLDLDADRADSDVDNEARTHRGGWSRSASGDERGRSVGRIGLELSEDALMSLGPMHRREEADTNQRGSTPTKLSAGSGKSKDKDKRSTGKKKDRVTKVERAKTKTEAKGRVAAWLGQIVPAEPPQEEVIPPSPSVARRAASVLRDSPPLEPEADDDVRLIGSIPPPPPPPEPADTNAEEKDISSAPNPRSSGFVPIHSLKRDTLPSHPVIEREMTVVEESRRITDMWAESPTVAKTPTAKTPATPPARPPVSTKPYAAILRDPAPQSIRTDRRVSPPSSKGHTITLGNAAAGSSNIVKGDPNPATKSAAPISNNAWRLAEPPFVTKAKPTLPPPPPPKPKNINLVKPVIRPPDFPPLPSRKQDPEIKYDVRSARGGKGGKVAAVTAMWASVAATGPPIKTRQPQKNDGLKLVQQNQVAGESMIDKPVPRLVGKIALPGLVKSDVAGGKSKSDVTSTSTAHTRQGAAPVAKPSPSQDKPLQDSFRPPRKPSATQNLANTNALGGVAIALARSKSAETSNALNKGRVIGDIKSKTPGKTTPNSLSTPSSGEPRFLDLASGTGAGGRRANGANLKPIIKSTSVPAVISSSHAVPVLSSTASLARPAVATPRVTANVVSKTSDFVVPKSDRPSTDRRLGISPSLAPIASSNASSSVPPSTKSPPPDLAFGQARLRDLIKKYQSQTT
ncbi:hypothetical protein FA15DRAFT_623931 [Coprinopsis marcescibilis]|uniref:Arrestin-like N-terminal domain-containing protein n=1 Tax=Coprinopsis marcescibilis TaxID=230819 RepID=A0A5C3KZV0_COPMA|nr:hypothetical protein FA15DRAFT_623931 [Coprinopsis marcescibilis]